MNKTYSITKIPYPRILLGEECSGIVYCIVTNSETEDEHEEKVKKGIAEIQNDFDNGYSASSLVSLRTVKKEIVHYNEFNSEYVSLVQFRIRDGY